MINFQNYRFVNNIDTTPLAENTKRTSAQLGNLAKLGKEIFTNVRDNNNKKKFLDIVQSYDEPRTEVENEIKDIDSKIQIYQAELDKVNSELSSIPSEEEEPMEGVDIVDTEEDTVNA